MGEIDEETREEMREADLRNGEPGATSWTEIDRPDSDPPEGSDEPVPSDAPELDQHPHEGRSPSDTDVQAERQPPL